MESFNPRAHEGHDTKIFLFESIFIVSIHVPTRGTTVLLLNLQKDISCFNPRAHEGHDVFSDKFNEYILKFQSTCPRGARPY